MPGKGRHAAGPLSPDYRYAVELARKTLQAHQAGGAEAVAGTVPPPPPVPGMAGLYGYAYAIAVDQLRQLLAVIDALTGQSS